MNPMQAKLERPERLKELDPEGTLGKIGIGEEDVVCDIGAGSGIFTIPAANRTGSTVFALDINEELLRIIREKAAGKDLHNVRAMKVSGYKYAIEERSVDLVLMVTVLHEIEDRDGLLTEIKRIMKDGGKFAVIEFHKHATPMGPPVTMRIGPEEASGMCERFGFKKTVAFDLGDNMYCIVFCA